tara:strand:- start:577 stop:1644 length:1068 start_codon:yes stop_codon:yes gene_type:complete
LKKINVNLKSRSYPIFIKSGLIKEISSFLDKLNAKRKWLIISQKNLMDLFGYEIQRNLIDLNYDCRSIVIPDGEIAKSLDEFSKIINQMILHECDRKTYIIALGGGVVGDVAGFVSSVYMRGINYVQIPTTLLSMVDSSIGGKTGINIESGKNMIGSINQPKAVYIDPNILKTLPKREITSGFGEIIKYGLIADKMFFDDLSKWLDDIDNVPIEKCIENCCRIKAIIVSQDERDRGIRKILNFGHTVGHALEAYFKFGKVKHGEAVALGMICSGYISYKLKMIDKEQYDRVKKTIYKLPLPKLENFDKKEVLKYLKNDKKFENKKLKFIYLNDIGHASITEKVDKKMIFESLLEI